MSCLLDAQLNGFMHLRVHTSSVGKITGDTKLSMRPLYPNTPNKMVNCIGALVRRRDGDTSAIWMVDIAFCNLKL